MDRWMDGQFSLGYVAFFFCPFQALFTPSVTFLPGVMVRVIVVRVSMSVYMT